MTPLFDGFDLAPDAAFLLWFAVGMAAIGLAIGAYMVGRWVWRRGASIIRENRKRRTRVHGRVEEQQERVARLFRELDKDTRRWG